jgi:hypothetical protein
MEVIASSEFNREGKSRSRFFTDSLIEELIGRATDPPFSTAELHVALLRRMNIRSSGDVERNPLPLYMVLGNPNQFRRGILLSPIRKARSHPSVDEIIARADSRAFGNYLKILISVKVGDEETLDVNLFKEWLRSVPSQTEHIKIEAGFSSL